MVSRIVPLVRPCLWVLGAGLLLEGAALLILGALPTDLLTMIPLVAELDPLHNVIHVVWGLIILGLLITGLTDSGAARLSLSFGVFYVAFGFLGILVHHPFGLILDIGQNAFHLIVGPAALCLGILSLRTRRSTG